MEADRSELNAFYSCPAATGVGISATCPQFPDHAHRCGHNRNHEHVDKDWLHTCTCGMQWISAIWTADTCPHCRIPIIGPGWPPTHRLGCPNLGWPDMRNDLTTGQDLWAPRTTTPPTATTNPTPTNSATTTPTSTAHPSPTPTAPTAEPTS